MVRDFFSKLLRREISSFVRISVTVAPLYPGRRQAGEGHDDTSRIGTIKSAPNVARVSLARLRSATTRCYASANRQSRPATYRAVCSKRAIGLTESRGAGGTDQGAMVH